jgi:16S rRNA (guanine527-N7)-methyltransferase
MSSVSRETPGAPTAARQYFGDRLDAVERYAELLAGPGMERGLIGPREVPRLWERHLLNCAVVEEAIPAEATVVDVGSGAGLPGVVLALLRPDVTMTLVEPLLRRATYLREVVAELGLANTEVVRARAEDLHGQVLADRVTARAVAPFEKLARWCLPLLRPGGALVALKGESVAAELAVAAERLEAFGAVSWEVRLYGASVVDPPTRVAFIEVGRDVRQA